MSLPFRGEHARAEDAPECSPPARPEDLRREREATPLVPRNTMVSRDCSFGLESGDLAEAVDLSEGPVPLLEAVDEHLRGFRDTLPTVSESDDDEGTGDGDCGHNEQQQQYAGHRAPLLSIEQDRASPRPRSGHQRSSSAPVKPLKSAFAKSPPNSPPEMASGTTTPRKKHARFVDDPTASDLSLRRTVTAPEGMSVAPVSGMGTVEVREEADEAYWACDGLSEGVGANERAVLRRREISSDESLKDALAAEVEDAEAELAEDAEEREDVDRNDSVIDEAVDEGILAWADEDPVQDDAIADNALIVEDEDEEVDGSEQDSEGEDGEDGSLSVEPSHTPFVQEISADEDTFDAREDEGSMEEAANPWEDEASSGLSSLPVIDEHKTMTMTPKPVFSRHYLPKPANERRLSDSQAAGHAGTVAKTTPRRASSMSDFQVIQSRARLRPFVSKAGPADVALTSTSVRAAEQPKLNTVYEHPGLRWRHDVYDRKPVHTEQTIYSGSSTYQILWEEPQHSDSDSDVTLFEAAEVPQVVEPEDSIMAHVSRSPSPMGKVRTKLAAWSWAREQEHEDDVVHLLPALSGSRRLQGRSPGGSEGPPAPPNTEKSGTSSAQRSAPQTPYFNEDEGDVGMQETGEDEGDVGLFADTEEAGEPEGEMLIETRDPPEQSRWEPMARVRPASTPAAMDYLSIAALSRSMAPSPVQRLANPAGRHWSDLASENEHFKTHRDSLDVSHRRLNDDKLSQQRRSSHDSTQLAKSKYDVRHPKAATAGPAIQYNRYGGLSPILDASPPDAKVQQGLKAMSNLAKESKAREESPHPDEHAGCAICEVERPRWFEANHRRKMHV
ncbi:hypothetical protein B0A50_08646 [Salinomyces thailandicus]|uniref:Uncharacterized protein n=1 Tax=Salinomyces thailandicus TaxID=706561 RepID=A0A4U0TJE9_9PEZI|nr:hypothetical protein B0A50_08646 [Salinomyces thailandica]